MLIQVSGTVVMPVATPLQIYLTITLSLGRNSVKCDGWQLVVGSCQAPITHYP
ncbi:hypothetical protein [Chroococcidiopsis sp.]|uniref:hypothetical protein n=1 Tax=Chroococcidiopsis sp. TaxID=3088168 RepID=UPI003F2D8BD1